MNTEKIDYAWAILSFTAVIVTYWYGVLLYGIVGIYVAFAVLMFYHIFKMNKRLSRTVAVFGTIVDYHVEKGIPTHYYPMLRYETEDGRAVTSVYSVAARKQDYDVDTEEMICYDPEDPLFFYFANSASEMTASYYRYMIFGAIPAFLVLIIAISK